MITGLYNTGMNNWLLPLDCCHISKQNLNKAIVDYTSSALCTPVIPFPPIGDAAYHQHAAGGPSHGHRQRAQKLVKVASVVPEIYSRTDRQTDRHADRHNHHNTSQPQPRAR